MIIFSAHNGLLLHYMPKQQDIFGSLAKILSYPGLREAANLKIWPLRSQRGPEVNLLRFMARTTKNWGWTSKNFVLYGVFKMVAKVSSEQKVHTLQLTNMSGSKKQLVGMTHFLLLLYKCTKVIGFYHSFEGAKMLPCP